jgi:rhomboid family GlyGly-CTERM serine protease
MNPANQPLHTTLFFLILSGLVAAIQISGDGLYSVMVFQRDAILQGDIWRLWSGHLVHGNWPHCWLNLGGLLLVWWMFGSLAQARSWVFATLVIGFGIALSMLLFEPEIHIYRGISGIQHGMLAFGVVLVWCQSRIWSLVLGMLIISKLLWEQFQGPLPSSQAMITGRVAIESHLYGVISGFVWALLTRLRISLPLKVRELTARSRSR